MQLDMHFYGTYAMARAAGLNVDTCTIIATSAQFVDDNAEDQFVVLKDGARMDIKATAHHSADTSNINLADQRFVWVPFHFLPGNEGASYTQRLLCRKDSVLAREMIDHHLSKSDEPYAVALIGVAAHVYADTFSHYGFSGVGSQRNQVKNSTIHLLELEGKIEKYIREKEKLFFSKHGEQGGWVDNIRALALEALEIASGALGHGSVATYPDRPYLSWHFDYEKYDQERSTRNNHATFIEACEALHALFSRFAIARPDLADYPPRSFSDIRAVVSDVLATQENCAGRIEAWRKAATRGDLFYSGRETLPTYTEDTWHMQRANLSQLPDSRDALTQDVFRFYQAAAIHRTYVLRDLMPKHELVID